MRTVYVFGSVVVQGKALLGGDPDMEYVPAIGFAVPACLIIGIWLVRPVRDDPMGSLAREAGSDPH